MHSLVARLEKDRDIELAAGFPQNHYVVMSNADTVKIFAKLKEFNDSAAGDGLRLSDDQLQLISELANGNTTNIEAKLNLIFQLLKWPTGKRTSLFFSEHLFLSLPLSR